MTCPICRTQLDPALARCPSCGAPAGRGAEPSGPRLADGDAPTGFTAAPTGAWISGPESADGDTPTGFPAAALAHTPAPDDAVTGFELGGELSDPATSTAAGSGQRPRGDASGPLFPGQNFGDRYHIVKLLGLGGMGAVYQAWDAELGVVVALKVIRIDAAADPAAAHALEQRFKQELLLARQVTHPNVVRIHDLGEIQGIKYITMPFVEGEDLSTVLRREGRLSVPRTLRIARSMISGLAAAHAAGVVHRDLKPANIMVKADGDALIMDFGIARSMEPAATVQSGVVSLPARAAAGQTLHGSVVGTIEYMAPEQARAEKIDQRADLYAFGLILYDLLLGRVRASRTGSAIAELTQRMKEPPPAPRTRDTAIPEALDRIISRCIQPDRDARFETAAEVAAELGRLDDNGKPLPIVRRLTRRMAVAAAASVAVLLGLTWWLARGPSVAVTLDPVSVLIADFSNPTKDAAFEGALEGALGIALENASFITSFDRAEARRIATQLNGRSQIDEPAARLIAVREGIRVILAGSIAASGSGYRVTVKGQNAGGTELWTQTAFARGRENVLAAVAEVASDIRSALGDTASQRNQMADAESVTTSSLEALQSYMAAQDAYGGGRFEEAVKGYQRSIASDDTFGRAYAGLANTLFFMGRKQEAEENWKKALSLMDRMTAREKYRTQGTYFFAVARNYEKAIDNYEMLVRDYPTDSSGLNNLAIAYFMVLNFPKAQEMGRRVLQLYPKNVIFRNNLALYAMYAGDFATATRESQPLLDEPGASPFFKIYLPPAIAAAVNGQFDVAERTYALMAKAGPEGASLAATGLADLAVYRGRYADAEKILSAAVQTDVEANNTSALAAKRLLLAEVLAATGRVPLAVGTAGQAVKMVRSESTLVPAARIFLRAGRMPEAQELAADLDNSLQTQSRAYAKVLDGNIWLLNRRRASAIDAFRDAKKFSDVWLARYDMGVTYVEAGAYAEAFSELEACQRRRGEATALFLDDVPTVRYLAELPYWLGRAQEGMGQQSAARASYRAFLSVRGSDAAADRLVLDARRRAGPEPAPSAARD